MTQTKTWGLQLNGMKTHLKLTEEKLKKIYNGHTKQIKTHGRAIYTREIARKKRQTFCCQKCMFLTFHMFI